MVGGCGRSAETKKESNRCAQWWRMSSSGANTRLQPRRRATWPATPSRKLNRPCAIAPIGLILQCTGLGPYWQVHHEPRKTINSKRSEGASDTLPPSNLPPPPTSEDGEQQPTEAAEVQDTVEVLLDEPPSQDLEASMARLAKHRRIGSVTIPREAVRHARLARAVRSQLQLASAQKDMSWPRLLNSERRELAIAALEKEKKALTDTILVEVHHGDADWDQAVRLADQGRFICNEK